MAPWAHGDVRSLAVEREWDGWDDFFKSGSLMLAAVGLISKSFNLEYSCAFRLLRDQALVLIQASLYQFMNTKRILVRLTLDRGIALKRDTGS